MTAAQSNSSRQGAPNGEVGSISMKPTTTISITATGFIHLYLLPLFQLPTSNESPARHRRKIGIAKEK